MTDKKVVKASVQQMKDYLTSIGVTTEVDFIAERLYVVSADMSYSSSPCIVVGVESKNDG